MAHAMMVIDTSKCIGCKACQVACQQWHSKEAEDTEFTGSLTNPPDKSGANFNVVKFSEYVDNDGVLRFLFFPDRCRHCLTPWCKEACPLGAVKQAPWGGVGINEAKCDTSKCNRECQTACPFKTGGPVPLGIPRFEYTKDTELVTLNTAQKCDFCYDRLTNAKLSASPFKGYFAQSIGDPPFSNRPACEVTCPTGALRCAKHTQAIPYAKRRVRNLKEMGFGDACLYPPPDPILGEVYTHMLWVLTQPPHAYGL